MGPIEFVAWLVFGAIWVGLVAFAVAVLVMSVGLVKSVHRAKRAPARQADLRGIVRQG
jgi:membrane protein implicated in regulation of membrane protease activity